MAHSVGESMVGNQLGAQLEQTLCEVGFGSHEGRLSIELRRVDDSSRGQYESHGSDGMVGVAFNGAPHPTRVVGYNAANGARFNARRVGPQTPSVSAQEGAGMPENDAGPGTKRKPSVLN